LLWFLRRFESGGGGVVRVFEDGQSVSRACCLLLFFGFVFCRFGASVVFLWEIWGLID
jgi:hypothetical protein